MPKLYLGYCRLLNVFLTDKSVEPRDLDIKKDIKERIPQAPSKQTLSYKISKESRDVHTRRHKLTEETEQGAGIILEGKAANACAL